MVSVQSQEAVESGNTDTSDVRNASGTVQPSTSASPSSDLSVKQEPANRSRIEDKAKSLVKKLSTVPSSEKAQGIIRELFDLDASKDVKQQGGKLLFLNWQAWLKRMAGWRKRSNIWQSMLKDIRKMR